MPAAILDVSRLLTVIPIERDPRAEFARLAMWCGWGPVDDAALEVTAHAHLDDLDGAVARHFNGEIKSVLWAAVDARGIEAFAGATLVPGGNLLSPHLDEMHHVHVAGIYRADNSGGARERDHQSIRRVTAPATEWLVRARFPGFAPHNDALSTLFARVGLQTMAASTHGNAHWRRIAATSRTRVESAITELRTCHRVTLTAIRAL